MKETKYQAFKSATENELNQFCQVNHPTSNASTNLNDTPKCCNRWVPLYVYVLLKVFHGGESRPVFYVASRGHHADIGGITPGSMPPHSKSIQEEGAVFKSFKLVDRGVFQEKGKVSTYSYAMFISLDWLIEKKIKCLV